MAVRRRGPSWQADATVNGQRFRVTFNTKTAAEAWVLRKKADALDNRYTAADDGRRQVTRRIRSRRSITIKEACDAAFQAYWRHTGERGPVWHNLQTIVRHFGPSAPVRSINTDAVDTFIQSCEHAGNSSGTINRKLAALSKTLRWCLERDYIARLPILRRQPEFNGRVRWLTEAEETALVSLIRSWGREDHAQAIEVLVDTGLRNSELWRLEGRDLNLAERTLTVWQTKTGNARTLYMTPRVFSILSSRYAHYGQGKLFPDSNNYWLRYVWDRARNHLGFADDKQFVPYICRHTCASRLVQRGVPLPVIKEWMGHKCLQMTMRYAHLSPVQLKAAADALSERSSPSTTPPDCSADRN